MATHWFRRHTQLTDLKPSHNHQHHLTATQYDILTQQKEATSLHYHRQLPLFCTPLKLAEDQSFVYAPYGGRGYATGFGRRGFAPVINPAAPLDLPPNTRSEVVYNTNPRGWVSLWAYRDRLLTSPVGRIGRWLTNSSIALGDPRDPTVPVSWRSYGVDLAPFRDSRPFLWIFGKNVRHTTRLRGIDDDGTQTVLDLADGVSAIPPDEGQWVYLAPPVRMDEGEVEATYLATVLFDGSRYQPQDFELLQPGTYAWNQPFYYNTTDTWYDADLSVIVPPTATAIDLQAISRRYTLAVGTYRVYQDANTLLRSVALYRSSTRLPDNSNRSCGSLSHVPLIWDDRSTPHLYIWSTRYATLYAATIHEG